jgi:hypothetical protein
MALFVRPSKNLGRPFGPGTLGREERSSEPCWSNYQTYGIYWDFTNKNTGNMMGIWNMYVFLQQNGTSEHSDHCNAISMDSFNG